MKVLLAFPRFRYVSGQPPLGISALYSYLKQTAPEVKVSVFDGTFDRFKLKGFEDIVKRNKFDIIGFSVMNTMIAEVRSLAELARRHLPASLIVVGGPHA